MAPPEDRSQAPTPSEVDPDGATEARYDADDNLDLDAGAEPHDGQVGGQHGRKTRLARKAEISKRPI